MTNTKTKTKTTKTAKKANVNATLTEAIATFDIEAALGAASTAPKTSVRSSNGSECLNAVKELLKSSSDGLTMNQIKAAYFAGLGIKDPSKKQLKAVYETVFQHSDVCHNKGRDPKKAIFTRDESGVYKLV